MKAIGNEAKGWRGQIAALRGADQATLDKFFGQPAPADIEAHLDKMGKRPDRMKPEEFRDLYYNAMEELTVDKSAYWPGKVVPVLRDLDTLLKFDAYREKLDGVANGPATAMLKRIDAFQGARGSRHAAGGGVYSLINAYINAQPRHPSETYAPPPDIRTDYLNAFDHTYSRCVFWRPATDMQTVEASIVRAYGPVENRYALIAGEEAKVKAALIERGGINAAVGVKLGKTYGEDAVVMTMSMEDYRQRFIPIMEGKIKIDRSVPGSLHHGHFSTQDAYSGYVPGKQAFFEADSLLVAKKVVDALDGDANIGRLNHARLALQFLRAAGSIAETAVEMPVAPGKTETFIEIRHRPDRKAEVRKIGNAYYSSTDLHNKTRRSLANIDAAINGGAFKSEPVSRQDKPDTEIFEHNGDMYLPRGTRYYQAALHMQHKYGIDYTWVISDGEAKKKAGGKDKYVIFTSKLAPEIRDAALADLKLRLEGRRRLEAPEKAVFIKNSTVSNHKKNQRIK